MVVVALLVVATVVVVAVVLVVATVVVMVVLVVAPWRSRSSLGAHSAILYSPLPVILHPLG